MIKKQTILFILLLAVFTMAFSGCTEQPKNNQVNNDNQQKEEQKDSNQSEEKEKKETDKDEDKKDNNDKEEVSTEIGYLDNGEIDTSDWKTYKNEVLNIEFKYPPDWSVEKRNNYIYIKSDLREAKIKKGLPVRLFDVKIGKFDSLKSLKAEYSDNNQLSFEDWLKKRSFVEQENITIDGRVAKKGYFKKAIGNSNFIYMEIEEGQYIEVELDFLSEDQKNKIIINKIISGLKL